MTKRLIQYLLLLLWAGDVMAQAPKLHNDWIDYSKTYYKVKVMGFGTDAVNMPIRNGMVRIPYSTLNAAGLAGVPAAQFQLWRNGEEVPVYLSTATGTLGNNDYIEFFGEINDGKLDKELYRNPDFQLCDKWSLQTDTAAYFLTVNSAGNNRRLVTVSNNVAGNTLPADSFFMYTVARYYRNTMSEGFSASLSKSVHSSSYDIGEGWVSRAVRPVAGCGSASLPQVFNNLYPYLQGPQMTVRVNSVGDMQDSRSVTINVNGDSITTFQMDYNNYEKTEEQADVSHIASGNATVQVVNNSTYGCDEMRVAMIELNYPRQFNMGGASVIDFMLDPSPAGRFLKIANFKSGGVAPVLYDLANGTRYVADISNPDTLQFALQPSESGYRMVLTTHAGVYYKSITTVQARQFTDYRLAKNQGNYLIVTNPLLNGSGPNNYIDQYAQYRASAKGGAFKPLIVDINELVDQYAWGIKKHPLAVKAFVNDALTRFADTPKYVFIIGKGMTYSEYRTNESNVLADKLNLVPTWGSPASDNLLASSDNNALPAIPIGRLSAVTPQEVGDYLLKVKQHDSLQAAPDQTLAAKAWMKNVLQVAGANDLGLGDQIDGYLETYRKVITDTTFGGKVTPFSKNADPDGYPDAVSSFRNIYESGASLITYFGHSSNTSLDFNLDNPERYNNYLKYPVFVANGCSAGNNYLFEPNRLNARSTVSEKFVLSPQRGAVGYLASTNFGIINYLDLYTLNFYKALASSRYNKNVGTAIRQAISASLDATGRNDFFSRVHAEQYAFNGDPAISINTPSLPDYVAEPSLLSVAAGKISVADTAYTIKARIYNIGKGTNDPVTVRITKTLPSGQSVVVFTKTFASIKVVDSISLTIPVTANTDKGRNTITIEADYTKSVTELSEDNNVASISFNILDQQVRPIHPFNYAIINEASVILSASSVDPLAPQQVYMAQLDTTALFNSPLLVTMTDTSTGGKITFDPRLNCLANTTYYWRVAVNNKDSAWTNASFIYKPDSKPGFQQGHLYQNLESSFKRLSLDSAGHYLYTSKQHNLFITNSVYPTSGTEDEHFSVSVDGSIVIASACAGASVIFHLFDPVTFQPVENTTRPYNASAVCDSSRKYNFEYQYGSAATRKNAMDFVDAIPKGYYVAVRIVLDQPYTFAPKWAADTTLYGKGNSLYHRLKQAGFTGIDSFTAARTWAFVYKKGDTSFKPAFTLSQGVYDRITLSVDCPTPHQSGTISSPTFGPARQWNNMTWRGAGMESGNDRPIVNIYATTPGKADSLLYTADSSQHNFDISAIDASQYPYLRLQLNNTDSITATPYQLSQWALTYQPVPEGAIAPNLYFAIPDSVGMLHTAPDSAFLPVGVAFANVSASGFDSLAVRITLIDSSGNRIRYPLQMLKPLPAGDTMHMDLKVNVGGLQGSYNLLLEVNPDQLQPEQYSFNNSLYKFVFIDQSQVLALGDIPFAARGEGRNVITSWVVPAGSTAKRCEVQYSSDGSRFTTLAMVPVSRTVAGYQYTHVTPQPGKNFYRLRVADLSGAISYSTIWLVTFAASQVMVYPNPTRDILTIDRKLAGGKAAVLKLLSASGQLVWQQKATLPTHVDVRHLAPGNYTLQVDDGQTLSAFKVQKQ